MENVTCMSLKQLSLSVWTRTNSVEILFYHRCSRTNKLTHGLSISGRNLHFLGRKYFDECVFGAINWVPRPREVTKDVNQSFSGDDDVYLQRRQTNAIIKRKRRCYPNVSQKQVIDSVAPTFLLSAPLLNKFILGIDVNQTEGGRRQYKTKIFTWTLLSRPR